MRQITEEQWEEYQIFKQLNNNIQEKIKELQAKLERLSSCDWFLSDEGHVLPSLEYLQTKYEIMQLQNFYEKGTVLELKEVAP